MGEFDQNWRDRAAGKKIVSYGLHGTPTQFYLEQALAELEGGHECRLYGSGLAANIMAILPFVKRGDHVLVSDSVYGPVRNFCSEWASRWGVETTYYDPMIGEEIEALFRPRTRVVVVEAPGSVTFEVQDVPALAAIARRRGVTVVMDNTWATPIFFKPFEHGVNISVQALTKYIVGHSDAMLGAVICDEEHWPAIKSAASEFGHHAAPDDVFLALRGLRSLGVRLQAHQENGFKVAAFLQSRPEVVRVRHPGLPGCPGHEIWKRDFRGASGLFAFELEPMARSRLALFIDHLKYFRLGGSWGGYESLIQPFDAATMRTAGSWPAKGPLVRIHVGLEDPEDLIADLGAGLDRMSLSADNST